MGEQGLRLRQIARREGLDGKPLAFAGLWESCELDGELLDTCAVLTTAPSGLSGLGAPGSEDGAQR